MIESWGNFEGEPVHRVRIAGGGLTARVITWGAVLQDLRMDGVDHPLVLGFERFDAYPDRSPFFGAIAGRVANRIARGRFPLDGRTVELATNPGSPHTLHGGPGGMGKRPWRLQDHGADFVLLAITDPDGLNGFPGTVEVTCRYTLTDGALHVALDATTDAPTPVNLAHHTYWNLDGSADARDHVFTSGATRFGEVDADFIPTGRTPPVEGTRFDFRTPRRLRDATAQGIVDHNLVLADARAPRREVARLEAGGLALAVSSTEPGLQLYAGHKLNGLEGGLDGRRYGPHAGIALEPQLWPDAVNQPHFPSMILRPNQRYEQRTTFRLERL